MGKFDYDRMIASLDDLRDAIMRKELTDVGWDLRDEVLALHEVVAALVQVVYEQGTPLLLDVDTDSPPPPLAALRKLTDELDPENGRF